MKNENSAFQKLLTKRWGLAQDTSPKAAEKLLALDKVFAKKYERTVAPFVLDRQGSRASRCSTAYCIISRSFSA